MVLSRSTAPISTLSFSLPVTTTVTDITSSANIDDNPQKDQTETITKEVETKSLHTLKAGSNPNLEKSSQTSFLTSKRSKIENAEEDAEDKAIEEVPETKSVR